MWDPPESASPALAGVFFTTEPSGKPNPDLSRAVLQIKMDIGCVRWNFAPALIYTQRHKVDCLSTRDVPKYGFSLTGNVVTLETPVGKEMLLGQGAQGMTSEEPQVKCVNTHKGRKIELHDGEGK